MNDDDKELVRRLMAKATAILEDTVETAAKSAEMTPEEWSAKMERKKQDDGSLRRPDPRCGG